MRIAGKGIRCSRIPLPDAMLTAPIITMTITNNGIARAGMGGNLCVLSLADGSVRELAPQLAGGLFDRYDLCFDGRQIVFGYCPAVDDGLRLWRINVDGSGLQQVTFPPPGETAAARAALGPNWRKPAEPGAHDPQGSVTTIAAKLRPAVRGRRSRCGTRPRGSRHSRVTRPRCGRSTTPPTCNRCSTAIASTATAVRLRKAN